MSGTFSSLNNALSALRYNQVAMDVANGNVSNAGTPGYARRQVVGQATGAPAVQAIWSRWEGAGDGVQASPVTRMVDPLLDSRARTEHADAAYLGTRATALTRFETTLGEPGDKGIAAALSAFKAGWQDVANGPGDDAARSQLISRGISLADAINRQAKAVSTEWSDDRTRLENRVAEVNQVAADLDKLNGALRSANMAGNDANILLDQRDQMTMRLAELTGAKATVNPDTTVSVTVSGATLVDGTGSTPAASVALTGPTDVRPLGGQLGITVGGTAVTVDNGEIGGGLSLLNGDLPGFLKSLDDFANALATDVNTLHAQGVDKNGIGGGAFFTGGDASTLAVAITDPVKVAAADSTKGGLDNTVATQMAKLDMGDKQYRSLITSFGVTVSTAKQRSANQDAMVAQVDASREALSGINVDEEMISLLMAQRGYEGAARVLTVMDSILDTLINRTGLVR